MQYKEEQIKELENNSKYVKQVRNNRITYTEKFKEEYWKWLKEWKSSKEIYKNLWFPEYVLNSHIPRKMKERWKIKEISKLSNNWKNKSKKIKKRELDFEKMDLKEQNEYLRAKLALYEELSWLDLWNFP